MRQGFFEVVSQHYPALMRRFAKVAISVLCGAATADASPIRHAAHVRFTILNIRTLPAKWSIDPLAIDPTKLERRFFHCLEWPSHTKPMTSLEILSLFLSLHPSVTAVYDKRATSILPPPKRLSKCIVWYVPTVSREARLHIFKA